MKKKKKNKKVKVALFDIDKEYKKYYRSEPTKSKAIPDYGKLPKIEGKQITEEDVRDFRLEDLEDQI